MKVSFILIIAWPLVLHALLAHGLLSEPQVSYRKPSRPIRVSMFMTNSALNYSMQTQWTIKIRGVGSSGSDFENIPIVFSQSGPISIARPPWLFSQSHRWMSDHVFVDFWTQHSTNIIETAWTHMLPPAFPLGVNASILDVLPQRGFSFCDTWKLLILGKNELRCWDLNNIDRVTAHVQVRCDGDVSQCNHAHVIHGTDVFNATIVPGSPITFLPVSLYNKLIPRTYKTRMKNQLPDWSRSVILKDTGGREYPVVIGQREMQIEINPDLSFTSVRMNLDPNDTRCYIGSRNIDHGFFFEYDNNGGGVMHLFPSYHNSHLKETFTFSILPVLVLFLFFWLSDELHEYHTKCHMANIIAIITELTGSILAFSIGAVYFYHDTAFKSRLTRVNWDASTENTDWAYIAIFSLSVVIFIEHMISIILLYITEDGSKTKSTTIWPKIAHSLQKWAFSPAGLNWEHVHVHIPFVRACRIFSYETLLLTICACMAIVPNIEISFPSMAITYAIAPFYMFARGRDFIYHYRTFPFKYYINSMRKIPYLAHSQQQEQYLLSNIARTFGTTVFSTVAICVLFANTFIMIVFCWVIVRYMFEPMTLVTISLYDNELVFALCLATTCISIGCWYALSPIRLNILFDGSSQFGKSIGHTTCPAIPRRKLS